MNPHHPQTTSQLPTAEQQQQQAFSQFYKIAGGPLSHRGAQAEPEENSLLVVVSPSVTPEVEAGGGDSLSDCSSSFSIDPVPTKKRPLLTSTSTTPTSSSNSISLWDEQDQAAVASHPGLKSVLEDLTKDDDDDFDRLFQAWNALGLIRMHSQQRPQRAVDCHLKSLEYCQSVRDRAVVWNDIGHCYEVMDRRQAALESYQAAQQALSSVEEEQPPAVLVATTGSQALSLSIQRNLLRMQRS